MSASPPPPGQDYTAGTFSSFAPCLAQGATPVRSRPMPRSDVLARPLAAATLATLACVFAANHIAARIAFEHGTGLLLAILCRSAVPVVSLGVLLAWRRERLALPPGTAGWQLLLGLLIATQSFCIYSAIVRIPVGLALLVVNLFPLLLVLLTWALGGPRPTRRAVAIMALILLGLGLALDVPARLEAEDDLPWPAGLGFALGAASAFAVALWITNNRLLAVHGPVRSLLTMLSVFICAAVAGASGVFPGALALPDALAGWLGLACLALLYGSAFSLLFVWVHRFDMARNAPVMNLEPVAAMFFAWLVLDQALSPIQVLGAVIVVLGIVLLTSRRS